MTRAQREQHDRDADRECEAAQGLGAAFQNDVKCEVCGYEKAPEHIHCPDCHRHHGAGDDYLCQFMQRCAADLKARWALNRRRTKRTTQHAIGQDTLRDGAMAAADPELCVKSSGPARPGGR